MALLLSASPCVAGLYVEGDFGGLKSTDKTYDSNSNPQVSTLPLNWDFGFRIGTLIKSMDLSLGYTNYTHAVNASHDGLLGGTVNLGLYDFQALAHLPVSKRFSILFGGSIGYAEIANGRVSSTTYFQPYKTDHRRYNQELDIKTKELIDNEIFETFLAGFEYRFNKYLAVNLTAKYLLLNPVRTRIESDQFDFEYLHDVRRISLNSIVGNLGVRLYME